MCFVLKGKYNMANVESNEISNLLALSEDELLAKIGIDVAGESLRLRPPSVQDLIQKGREWLIANMQMLQNQVCRDLELRRMVENPTDNQVLAIAVLDLITSYVVGVSPITVTALLIKRGLRNLCRECWKNTLDTE
jgi:hypothetical protein